MGDALLFILGYTLVIMGIVLTTRAFFEKFNYRQTFVVTLSVAAVLMGVGLFIVIKMYFSALFV